MPTKDAFPPAAGDAGSGRLRDGTPLAMINRLRDKWQRSSFIKSRLIAIGHLLSGNATNAIIMLVSTTIAARALGAQAYGVLALVLTIGRISERLLRFESWQPLIRFAAMDNTERDPKRLSELFLYGLLLDIGSAVLAGVLTVIGGWLLMPVLHLQPGDMPLVAIYALAIACNIRGMPTAALRLDGQFRTLAYIQLFASVLRVGLAVAAMLSGASLMTFVIIWTGAQIIDSLLFVWLGFHVLHKLDIPNPLRADIRGLTEKFPGFMRFAWSTNISGTLRTFTQEADTLLIGALVGTSWAGFYHIAKRIAKVAQQVGSMIQAVVYPDMARMWARADITAFRKTTARLQLVLAAIGLAMLGITWLAGDLLINFAFGKEFAAAFPLLIAQLMAVVLIMHAAPSRSALLAMHRPGFILVIALLSTVLFFAVAFLTIPIYGALGANLAHIAFAALTAVAMDIAWWGGVRDASRRQEAAVAVPATE